MNLLVGENASGKTRALNIIHSLAQVFAGKKRIREGHWHTLFVSDETYIKYVLEISGGTVDRERLTVGEETKLERGPDGSGSIDAADEGKKIKFKVPESDPAAIAKRDLMQHPFLECFHDWAGGLRYYPFGTHMGQDHLGVILETGGKKPDASDYQEVGGLFRHGLKELGPEFKGAVVQDMRRIGYELEDVGLDKLPDITVRTPLVGPLVGLYAKESDMRANTWQLQMSQGMFRALSLIIHSVYAQFVSKPSCVIVDDVGEGLDHERSTELIRVLMDRAERNAIQLIMATNDRFVMNAVPLEAWCCLRRTPQGSEVLTYENSKDLFDEFKLTGLNNFDFLATKFFSTDSADDE